MGWAMGPAWRHMRTDRSVVNQRLEPGHRPAGARRSPGRTAG